MVIDKNIIKIMTNVIVSSINGIQTIKTLPSIKTLELNEKGSMKYVSKGSIKCVSAYPIIFNCMMKIKKGNANLTFDLMDFNPIHKNEYIQIDNCEKKISSRKLCKELTIDLEPNSEITISLLYELPELESVARFSEWKQIREIERKLNQE